MKYIQMSAKREGDNREYGAIYYGVSEKTARELFEMECPQYHTEGWTVKAKAYDDHA